MGLIEKVLADAVARLNERSFGAVDPSDLAWYAFPQVWPTTALGHGGVGGQTMTHAQTVVVLGGPALVYFGGRFAYMVKEPKEKFYFALANQSMPERARRMEVEG